MRKWYLVLLIVALGLVPACGHLTVLQRVQQSHDALALAQDAEASICWGVNSIAEAMAAKVPENHCTTQLAAQVKLTDERHQSISKAFKKAFDDHAVLTTIAASGAKSPDSSVVNADVATLVKLASELLQSSVTVSQLQVQLKKAGAQ